MGSMRSIGLNLFTLCLVLGVSACSGESTSTSESPVTSKTESPPPKPVVLDAATLSAAGCDADRALQVFTQCKVCHSVDPGAANLTGPNLYGVVGRPAASREGFAYSKVIRESGIVWSEETLNEFLAKPLEYLPNNRMAFGGVTNADDRQAIVCLLTTLR